jgi:streptogramin lyase
VAATDTHIYFANWNLNSIQRLQLSNNAVQTVSATAAANANPHRVATNGTNVWWTAWWAGSVRRAPVGGGASNDVATGQGAGGPLGIAIDGTNVYWTNEVANKVSFAPLLGTVPSDLASGQDVPRGIAVDATHAYWVNNGSSGTIRRVLKGGGTTETLATLQLGPSFLAVDATAIYWTNTTGGTVMRLAK